MTAIKRSATAVTTAAALVTALAASAYAMGGATGNRYSERYDTPAWPYEGSTQMIQTTKTAAGQVTLTTSAVFSDANASGAPGPYDAPGWSHRSLSKREFFGR